MRFGSVCSGIEAASVAWEPLGWEPAWFSEIDPFPSAVLAHRFPHVPNLGDMTTLHEKDEFKNGTVDLLVGGTPCQSFSVAGLRRGLEDPRGNLALVFLGLVARARPRWVVWENVPGVLSSNGGRDFGAFLGALAELGYGWAYRILDAQFFGVPQRRRRVFVVGCLGDWRRAGAVLFERAGLRGDPAAGRGQEVQLAQCLTAGTGKRYDAETETLIAQALFVPAVFQQNQRNEIRLMGGDGQIAGALQAEAGMKQQNYLLVKEEPSADVLMDRRNNLMAFHATQTPISGQVSPCLGSNSLIGTIAPFVRRLTPRECERLQGFPDDWTLVPYRGKPAADGPRYRACGNSMAVPVMRWVGERIKAQS